MRFSLQLKTKSNINMIKMTVVGKMNSWPYLFDS